MTHWFSSLIQIKLPSGGIHIATLFLFSKQIVIVHMHYYHFRFADYSHRLPVTWLENSGEGNTPSEVLEDRGKGAAKGQPKWEKLTSTIIKHMV